MKPRRKHKFRRYLGCYAFLLPNFIGFLAFVSLPVIASLLLAFMNWNLVKGLPKFVGLGNFIQLLGFHYKDGTLVANDPRFWFYFFNTVFMMLAIPINMFAALGIALVMNKKLRGIVFFRTIYFLPTICAGVALYMIWRWVYNPDYGLLNSLLQGAARLFHLSISGPRWLSDVRAKVAVPKLSLMLMGFWISMGGRNMILYLAGLKGIDPELYEAADIDGASAWQKFWQITWPMLSPTTFFIFIMSMIGGFQAGFERAYIMTGGGPAGGTITISYYIYNKAFQWFQMGYASSIAWFLFILVFIVTMVNWRFGGRLVHY